MKFLSKALILIFFILLFLSFRYTFSQQNKLSNNKKDSISGLKTNGYDNTIMHFWLRNGKLIKGNINNIKGDTVEIIDIYGKQNIVNKKNIVNTSMPGIVSPSLGFGMGVPYGYLGLNIDYPVYRFFNISAGIGSNFKENTYLWNVGTNIYLAKERLRPRISAYYGINSFLLMVGSSYEQFKGISFGAGFDARVYYRHGFDFSFLYIYSPSFNKACRDIQQSGWKIDKHTSPLVLSFGYRLFY
jgi:hypothetical protein